MLRSIYTPSAEFPLDICVATDREMPANADDMIAKVVPGSWCAVPRHIGSEDSCQRVTFFPDLPEPEAATAIFLP